MTPNPTGPDRLRELADDFEREPPSCECVTPECVTPPPNFAFPQHQESCARRAAWLKRNSACSILEEHGVALARFAALAWEMAEIIADSEDLPALDFDHKWFEHPWYAMEYEEMAKIVLARARELEEVLG